MQKHREIEKASLLAIKPTGGIKKSDVVAHLNFMEENKNYESNYGNV